MRTCSCPRASTWQRLFYIASHDSLIHLMSTLCAGLGQKDDGPVCSVTGSAFEAVPLCLLMAQWTSLYVGFDLGWFGFCKSTVYSYSLELLCNFIAVPTISHYWCMTVSLKKGPGRKQLASAVRSIIDAGQRPRMQGRYAMLKCWSYHCYLPPILESWEFHLCINTLAM